MANYTDPDEWYSKSLGEKIKNEVFSFWFEDRKAPFWKVISSLLTTSEDQSVKADRAQASLDAILKELRELRAKVDSK